MSIKFEKNAYLDAVMQKHYFQNDNDIFNHVKTGLKFDYVDMTFSNFTDHYSESGWLGRKVIAIPLAIWSAVVMTIYYLVKAIFGLIKAITSDCNYFKAQLYTIARNFQLSFGCLSSLIEDKYGLYHMQESEFHKKCYDCFLTNVWPSRHHQQNEINRNRNTNRNPVYEATSPFQSATNLNSFVNASNKQKSTYTEADLDKELETNSDLRDSNQDEIRYAQLAENNLMSGCLDKAVEAIGKIYRDTKTKEAFLARVAETYYTRGDLEKALEAIGKIYSDTKIKEAFLARVADTYYVKGDLEKALETIGKIYSDTKINEAFLARVAETYYAKGDLEKAFEVTVSINTEERDKILIKIVNHYVSCCQKDRALLVIDKIRAVETKLTLMITIAQMFFQERNEGMVIEIFELIIRESIKSKFIKNGSSSLYLEVIVKTPNCEIKEFFAELAKLCFVETKEFFISTDVTNLDTVTQDLNTIFQTIIKKATQDSTLEAFLNLKFRESSAKTEPLKADPSSNQSNSDSTRQRSREPLSSNTQYYTILELSLTATHEDIRTAYKKLAKQYHPDMIQRKENEEETEFEKRKTIYQEKFKMISNAHKVLLGG